MTRTEERVEHEQEPGPTLRTEPTGFGGGRDITDGPFVRALLHEWARETGPGRLPEWTRPPRREPPAVATRDLENATATLATAMELGERGSLTEITECAEWTSEGTYARVVTAWRPAVGRSSHLDGGELEVRAAMWLAASKSAAKIGDETLRGPAVRGAFVRAVELAATVWALAPSLHDRFGPEIEQPILQPACSPPSREWQALGPLIQVAEAATGEAVLRARASEGAPRGAALRRDARAQAALALTACEPALIDLVPASAGDWFVTKQTVSCLVTHARKETIGASRERETRSLIERSGRAWAAWSAARFIVNGLLDASEHREAAR